jgi:2-amino-4-hydroxy-6-hydroxymethyldihydropteridine diphosphokinase
VPSSTAAGSASSPPARVRVAVGLGSNLGDRRRTLDAAASRLAAFLDDLLVSSPHDTAPVGFVDQPRFLNAAAIGVTTLAPAPLLEVLLAIEREFGRERPFQGAPRTLDLDLLLYGERRIRVPGLEIPHPRFRDRAFVLDPLSEIAPDWVDPVTGLTIAELQARLRL